MNTYQRTDGRGCDELRPVTCSTCVVDEAGRTTGIAPYADGAVLASFGDTRVICAASFEKKIPRWISQQGIGGGWITAEYSMLPYSTLERKRRDSRRGSIEGRTIEIQRLIGRSLRAICDLQKLPRWTLWLDCDVLQADGGTRTASITGVYVAARLAVQRLVSSGHLKENPFFDSVAAVSVGICDGVELLDLNYAEDKTASVDFNVVMTGSGSYVELQGTGEEGSFSQRQLDNLLALAKGGAVQLTDLQNERISAEIG